jgi:hypothetical protein
MESAPRNDVATGLSSHDHAVSRSIELIACAKTAWKVQQQQQQQQQRDPSSPPLPSTPPSFRLASTSDPPPQSLKMLEDGLTLLRSMEFGLKHLQVLVRRRGQTNDPTQEIATLQKQLEQDSQELSEFCQQILKIRRRTQEKRHWELVVQWFQHVADHYSKRLQECLKLRGEILAEQTQQRRKLVDSKTSKRKTNVGNRGIAGAGASSATPLFNSPLFSPPPRLGGGAETPVGRGDGTNWPPPPPSAPRVLQTPNGNGSTESSSAAYASNGSTAHLNPATSANTPSSSATTYYGRSNPSDMYRNGSAYGANFGYGGGSGYGGGGYGGGTGSFATGMRQRKGGPVEMSSAIPIQEQQEEEEKVHSQIQVRKQKRQTQQRLDEARMAETKLGELGQMFGKMSTLISQQGEILEKIEDDVESALADVTAGQEELTTLYALKKGNRPLIIKVFAVLIFLICFMRYYKK